MEIEMRSLFRTISAVAFGSVILLLSLDAAQARCSVAPFTFKFGEQRSMSMTADSGAPCNIKLWEGNGTVIKSLVTASRPAKGFATPKNSLNLTYRSRAGFQGEDKFVFNIVGTKHGVRSTATVLVSVSVGNAGPSTYTIAASNGTRSTSARKAPRQAKAPNTLQMTCLQQAGASIDPVTKRWTFYATERDGASRTDMYRLCLAGGDRQKAKSIAVREYPTNPGGSVPQRN